MAQLEVVGGATPQQSTEQDWLDREKHLLADLDSQVEWYQTNSTAARRWHRGLGVIVLLCAVLAPVTVVSSTGSAAGSLINPSILTAISVVITLIIALAEGLRRNFRYEERWTACSTSRDQLKWLKEDYLDQQVGKPVGSDPWVETLLKTRRDIQAVVMNETKQFFDVVRQDGSKSAPSGKN
jgi:uncharacterized protein DUF4231